MVVKVAMADHFQFKVMPSIKNFCLLKQGDVHYIGGTDILPAPLGASEEQNAIEAL
ncbi:MAG: RNA polymerase sporulation sigma factor SigE, partial [Lachnospira eligens]